MFQRAFDTIQERLKVVTKWDDVVPTLDGKNVVVMPWCEEEACEDDIKERSGKRLVSSCIHYTTPYSLLTSLSFRFRSAEPADERAPSAGAKSLAIPFDQKRWGEMPAGQKCLACGKDAKRWTMFGRSY